MGEVLAYWMRWPSVENFFLQTTGSWALFETFHFIGLALLVGIVGMFDLRILGMAKRVPVAPLAELLPWAVLGFVLAVVTGLGFVTGLKANLYDADPYNVLMTDVYLQLKLIFIGLAGLNLLFFYASGMQRVVYALGPGEDAPGLAKFIAGTSLTLWIGVVWMGRMVPWGL
ncbi:MAG: hypothetical protein HYY76_12620 [Acidobacteria bacterium]|nr:hypothetical protein [Acidobacteriota bacterium]